MKTFPILLDAPPTLEELGISVPMSEREKMERSSQERLGIGETTERRGNAGVSDVDLKAYI